MRKDSITIATLPATAKAPMRLERLPNDLPKLKKWLDRVAREGELQACQHDKRDAADLARLYRAGELVPVRIPREADERVRDVVRCRETFQREILTSRHHIVTFLATRGVVFREGTNWCTPHLQWLQHLTTDASPLAAEDRLVSREYRALLMYKLQRREEPLGLDSGGMTAQPDRPDSGSRGERSSQGGSCPYCAPRQTR